MTRCPTCGFSVAPALLAAAVETQPGSPRYDGADAWNASHDLSAIDTKAPRLTIEVVRQVAESYYPAVSTLAQAFDCQPAEFLGAVQAGKIEVHEVVVRLLRGEHMLPLST